MNPSRYTFGEAELAALRESVMGEMSPKRFHHTAAVEDMVTRLATLYCPDEIPALLDEETPQQLLMSAFRKYRR